MARGQPVWAARGAREPRADAAPPLQRLEQRKRRSGKFYTGACNERYHYLYVRVMRM